jgi:type VI secretion system protein VasJ
MWAAYGKHPAIKDYFRVGGDFPLFKVFSGWVEAGYERRSKGGGRDDQNIWRFWARGTVNGTVVCGLVRDSQDGIGRRYPFLILGVGPMPHWEENWDLIPLACAAPWADIERLSSQDFADLKKMQAEMAQISEPQCQWRILQSRKDLSFGGRSRIKVTDFIGPAVFDDFIPLEPTPHQDRYLKESDWHALVRSHISGVPSVVFAGESLGRFFMRFFNRPLAPGDFISLWDAGKNDISRGGMA